MSAVAMAIPGADCMLAAALGIAAISDRLNLERRAEIVSLLKHEVDLIGYRLDPTRGIREK